ncbi:MAG TPA: polysaccharide pyruvyl transferase family protein, partial [Glaciihabitans sp.]|nr:polysaccharide pyruvyl transferase family protein [Glaciihabitans sp.]
IAETDLDVVFFAHFGSTDTAVSVGDSLVHEAILAKMTSTRAQIVPTTHSPAAAHIARGAALSISSRYHPAVFAVSAGVPTIGISVDDYTHTKLTGALGNFGQTAVLPLTELLAGAGPALAAEVWSNRESIRSEGQRTTESNRAGSAVWWDRVVAAFQPRA